MQHPFHEAPPVSRFNVRFGTRARIRRRPRPPEMGVVRVVGGGHRPPAAGQHVQIIGVVSVGGHERVIAAAHRDDVAVRDADRCIAPLSIDAMEAVTVRVAVAEIVDLVEIGLARRIVDVVLVRRIAGPVAARREHLAHQQTVGRKGRRHDVDDLAGGVAAAANLLAAIARLDDARGQAERPRPHGDHGAAVGDFRFLRGLEIEADPGRQIHGVWIRREHVGARANPCDPARPPDLERAAQQHEASFLVRRPAAPSPAGRQMADREMNIAPAERARRQIHRRSGPPGGTRRDR